MWPTILSREQFPNNRYCPTRARLEAKAQSNFPVAAANRVHRQRLENPAILAELLRRVPETPWFLTFVRCCVGPPCQFFSASARPSPPGSPFVPRAHSK